LDSELLEHARMRLRTVPPDQYPEQAQLILRELTVSENNAARRVDATMNLLGELTAVSIEAPDLDFEPEGWVWRAEALTDLVNALHQRIATLQMALSRTGPAGATS
jgi:hypothetical protein